MIIVREAVHTLQSRLLALVIPAKPGIFDTFQ